MAVCGGIWAGEGRYVCLGRGERTTSVCRVCWVLARCVFLCGSRYRYSHEACRILNHPVHPSSHSLRNLNNPRHSSLFCAAHDPLHTLSFFSPPSHTITRPASPHHHSTGVSSAGLPPGIILAKASLVC